MRNQPLRSDAPSTGWQTMAAEVPAQDGLSSSSQNATNSERQTAAHRRMRVDSSAGKAARSQLPENTALTADELLGVMNCSGIPVTPRARHVRLSGVGYARSAALSSNQADSIRNQPSRDKRTLLLEVAIGIILNQVESDDPARWAAPCRSSIVCQ